MQIAGKTATAGFGENHPKRPPSALNSQYHVSETDIEPEADEWMWTDGAEGHNHNELLPRGCGVLRARRPPVPQLEM
jgi:hypothetical protein